MAEKIKIIDYIHTQLKERYKTFALYGPAMNGKSALAKKLADKTGALYIDLLAEFVSNIDLSSNIDIFEPKDLKDYLRKSAFNGRLIIIDNIDFLINTWDNLNKEHFLNFIDKDEYKIAYCFILQESKFLRESNVVNSLGQSRIFNVYNVE